MNKENFEEKKADIEAMDANEVKEPNSPVSVYIQESEDLSEWARQDEAALTEAGLDPELLHDIPKRAGALRYAQSVWQREYNTYEDAQREWNEKSPGAFELHDVMIHEFLHAYRNHPDLLAKVRNIAEGSGNADMLQDLSDMAILGKANPAPLEAIKFDITLLDTSETMSSELATLLAKSNGLRQADNEYKITRDKAYTYLKQAVDEVRRHGQYKFWRTPERKRGYASKYRRNRKSSSAKGEEPAATN